VEMGFAAAAATRCLALISRRPHLATMQSLLAQLYAAVFMAAPLALAVVPPCSSLPPLPCLPHPPHHTSRAPAAGGDGRWPPRSPAAAAVSASAADLVGFLLRVPLPLPCPAPGAAGLEAVAEAAMAAAEGASDGSGSPAVHVRGSGMGALVAWLTAGGRRAGKAWVTSSRTIAIAIRSLRVALDVVGSRSVCEEALAARPPCPTDSAATHLAGRLLAHH
jgi:hypothetical protein